MNLRVLVPTAVLIDRDVAKINAEAANGAFCIKPRHIDFVATLVPGLLSFSTGESEETFLAIDEGVLVKRGDEVLVSTRNAVESGDLESLRRTVREEFAVRDERERKTRSAIARLEADLVRRFIEF